MKHISTLLLIFSAAFSFAQDTLYSFSGEKISAKVLEISQTEIKYKKSNNIDGPTYIIDKNSVASIEYKNGSKESFETNTVPNNDQQTAANNNTYNQQPQSRSRSNIILGGGWGRAGGYNNWGWYGGYRAYPRVRYYRHHYYGSHYSHHYHSGRRGR